MVLGHFHERVGESPRKYEKFGASGSKKSLFVPDMNMATMRKVKMPGMMKMGKNHPKPREGKVKTVFFFKYSSCTSNQFNPRIKGLSLTKESAFSERKIILAGADFSAFVLFHQMEAFSA